MLRLINSLLLSGFVFGLLASSSQALAFDPNEALRQERERHQSPKMREEKEHYQNYRNRQTSRINNDGTVTIGKLQWMRCSLGQQWNGTTCTGNATEHNWNDARALPRLMNAQGGFAGHRDWRLPTVSELASLRVCSSGRARGTSNLPDDVTTFTWCGGRYSWPTLDIHLFPNTPANSFWSSSPFADYPFSAWNVGFRHGHVFGNGKDYDDHVRLVRDIQ